MNNVFRRSFFQAVLLFPLAVLILFLGSLLFHYEKLTGLDLQFEKKLKDHYSSSGPWDRSDVRKALPEIDDNTIVVLGESSLIVPGSCDGTAPSAETFPALLKKTLPHKFKVLNLGYCGDDSRGVEGVVRYLLSHKRPRAFLFYFGHNDYSNAARELLHRQTEFLDTDFWLKNLFSFLPGGMKFQLEHIAKNAFEAFLIKTFRILNPELFKKENYYKYSLMMTEQIEKKIQIISGLTEKAGLPAVFISPVGNLFYPPVGSDDEVVSLWKNGLQKKDDSLLIQASEMDFFGYDQRAKSGIAAAYRSLRGRLVRLLDLPASLQRVSFLRKQEFFSDIFHFSPAGHKWVLSELQKNGLVEFLKGP